MTDEEFRQPGTGDEDKGPRYWSPSNAFARFGRKDALLDMMNARIKPFGSVWDPARFARRQFLTSKEPVTSVPPLLRQNPEYLTSAQAAFLRRETVNAQMDQLHALDQQLATTRERISGQEKEAAKTARLRAEHGRIASSLAGGSPTADLLGIIGTELVLEVADRRNASDRRQRILNIGRRGAAATRPLSTSAAGRTNRTGAKSTRPGAVAVAESAAVPGPSPGSKSTAAKVGRTGSNPLTQKAQGESAGSREARAKMENSQEISRTRTTPTKRATARQGLFDTPTRTGMSQLLQLLEAPRVRAGARVRTTTQGNLLQVQPNRRLAPGAEASSPLPSAAALTGQQLQGVSSAPGRCDCPKPEKPKKKQFACSNPIISRSVSKDGVITIKRKLQCPPSKPK